MSALVQLVLCSRWQLQASTQPQINVCACVWFSPAVALAQAQSPPATTGSVQRAGQTINSGIDRAVNGTTNAINSVANGERASAQCGSSPRTLRLMLTRLCLLFPPFSGHQQTLRLAGQSPRGCRALPTQHRRLWRHSPMVRVCVGGDRCTTSW